MPLQREVHHHRGLRSPAGAAGRWSVRLVLAGLVGLLLAVTGVAPVVLGGGAPGLAFVFATGVSFVGAVVTALVAIVLEHDRSPLVIAALVLAAIPALVFVATVLSAP